MHSSDAWLTTLIPSGLALCNAVHISPHCSLWENTSYQHYSKNLGQLWLAYTELQVDHYMLQLNSVESGHFTQLEPFS